MVKTSFGLRREALCTSALVLLLASGCTASAKLGEKTGAGGEESAGGGSSTGGQSSTGGAGGTGGQGAGGTGGQGGFLDTGGQDGQPVGQIFVHDLSTLYRFDPMELELTLVGPFDCALADPSGSADSGMQDIAIDKEGLMFGVAKMGGQSEGSYQDHVIVSIDRTTGHCEKEIVIPKNIIEGAGLVEVRGLSFVPAGTLDPDMEVLVGLELGGSYLRINLPTKTVQLQGNLNGDGPAIWGTKGADIVSIIGDKTYTTAKMGETYDRLCIMDPVTGAITQSFAPTNLVTIGGMAYWAGTLYAFSGEGEVYSIDPTTGVPTPLSVIGAPPGIEYHGAGVTTAAPLTTPE